MKFSKEQILFLQQNKLYLVNDLFEHGKIECLTAKKTKTFNYEIVFKIEQDTEILRELIEDELGVEIIEINEVE